VKQEVVDFGSETLQVQSSVSSERIQSSFRQFHEMFYQREPVPVPPLPCLPASAMCENGFGSVGVGGAPAGPLAAHRGPHQAGQMGSYYIPAAAYGSLSAAGMAVAAAAAAQSSMSPTSTATSHTPHTPQTPEERQDREHEPYLPLSLFT
jgi:hypothetical protein